MKPSVCFVCLYCCLPSMVSAWASKAKAVFGQLAADEKSNEITAVPELLELLDGSAKNRHRLFTVTIARCHVSTERLRCKKKRAVKNRIENHPSQLWLLRLLQLQAFRPVLQILILNRDRLLPPGSGYFTCARQGYLPYLKYRG